MKLWLDDERPAPVGWTHAKTAAEAAVLVRAGQVAQVSLDHDLGAGPSGYFVAELIEQLAHDGGIPRLAWAVHSMNPVGAARMRAALAKADQYWDEQEEKEKAARSPGGNG